MEPERKTNYSNYVFFILLMIFILFQLVLYKYMIDKSDYIVHMGIVSSLFNGNHAEGYPAQMKAYPLFHILTLLISYVFQGNTDAAGICVLIMANVASVIIVRRLLNDLSGTKTAGYKYVIDFVSIAYLIFAPMAGFLTDGRFYRRQCGPNPWHNPTITFVRPVGLLALFFFISVMKAMEKKSNTKEYCKALLGFSVFSVLSVLAKPCFMMVFMPAMGIYAFDYWVRDLKGRLPDAMRLLGAVIPAFIILLGQSFYFQFVNDGTAGAVGFCLGGFSEFTFTEIICVSVATFPVPIVALLLYRGEILKSVETKLAYIALLIGFIEMFMLTNGPTGDFSWGYDLAVGLSTAVVLGQSFCLCDKKNDWRRIPLIILFLIQVVMGGLYVFVLYHNGGREWF